MDAGYAREVVSCLLLVLGYSLRLVHLLMP
jgi:hypothetical protein